MNLIIEIIKSALPAAIPILLAALGGLFTWHANVFNISMEGMLLASSFTAVLGSYYSGSWIIGLICGILGALLISLLFSFFVLRMKTGEFITGIAINTFTVGFTTYLLRSIFNVKGSLIDSKIIGVPKLNIELLKSIPIIGSILHGQSILVFVAIIIIVPICHIYLYKSPFGLRLRASGKDKKVVDSLGIKSDMLSFKAIIICGILCGIGGTFLSLGLMTMFTENMSNGRGWISLAAIIVAQGNPIKVLQICLIFGLMEGMGMAVQQFNIPSQITSMLPYLSVLVALYINSKVKPKSDIDEEVQQIKTI